MELFRQLVESAGLLVDGLGVLVILLGMGYAGLRFMRRPRQQREPFRRLRQDLGRGILLGLEFLVAADIIRTVAVEPTLNSVLVLALIVLVRTFLSMALEVELNGEWPWRRGPESRPAGASPRADL